MTRGRPAVAAALFVAVGVLGAALGIGFGVGAAGADPIGNCTTSAGTIVAVDFAHWGGPIVRGCGVNQPNGYALLHAAGFTTTGDNHDGPAFICRIGNRAFAGGTQYPTPAQDPCILTPPASAYWSYWRAPAGQSTWSYSSGGAMSTVPKPGEVELWMFGGTNLDGTSGSGVPAISPDSVRAHNTAPTGGSNPGPTPTTRASAVPSTVPRETPGTVGARGPNAGPTPGSGTDANQGGPGSTIAPGSRSTMTSIPETPVKGTTSTTTTSASTAGADRTRAPEFVDALPAVRERGSAGSVVPLLIGVGLIVALGGGAAGTMWRRRQRE
jgi:hypothetical protein